MLSGGNSETVIAKLLNQNKFLERIIIEMILNVSSI